LEYVKQINIGKQQGTTMDIQKQILINTLICQQVMMSNMLFISWAVYGVGR